MNTHDYNDYASYYRARAAEARQRSISTNDIIQSTIAHNEFTIFTLKSKDEEETAMRIREARQFKASEQRRLRSLLSYL